MSKIIRPPVYLLAILWISIVGGALPTSAELRDDTPVLVALDTTATADCIVSIDNGPAQACPPGSVVEVWQTTYAEVKAKEIVTYAVLTGNAKKDAQMHDQLANSVHKQTQGDILRPQTALGCVAHTNKVISGSYTFSTGNRVFYQMAYDFDNQCNVFNVKDKTADDGSGATWLQSCTDALSGINPRCNTQNIPLTTTYTGWKAEQNSFAGKQYRHKSQYGLHSAYGYYNFD